MTSLQRHAKTMTVAIVIEDWHFLPSSQENKSTDWKFECCWGEFRCGELLRAKFCTRWPGDGESPLFTFCWLLLDSRDERLPGAGCIFFLRSWWQEAWIDSGFVTFWTHGDFKDSHYGYRLPGTAVTFNIPKVFTPLEPQQSAVSSILESSFVSSPRLCIIVFIVSFCVLWILVNHNEPILRIHEQGGLPLRDIVSKCFSPPL